MNFIPSRFIYTHAYEALYTISPQNDDVTYLKCVLV